MKKKGVQSAKIWHEGAKWFLIVSVAVVGAPAEKGRYGPFEDVDQVIKKLTEISKESK